MLVAIVGAILVIENPFATSPVSKQGQNSGPPIGTEIGWQAPNFKLDALDGGEFSLNGFRGKVVVVNFWATWCPFCVSEMPAFEKLNKELGDQIVIIGINRAETMDKQREFLGKDLTVKITYKLLLDPSDRVAQAYGVRVMPTTFFLNEEGIIAKKKLGELSSDEMKQLVSESSVKAGGGENAPQGPPGKGGQNVAPAPPKEQAIEGVKIQITNGVKHIVPLNRIFSGGPPKDGIPSIDSPKFVSKDEGDKFLRNDDLVLGLFLDGEARAYPRMVLVWHEIVNDKIKGKPVLITYCPLCYTGAAFVREINGEEVEFGVSGKLYNSDLVMYDRKTDTYWSQVLGQAIVGELAGSKLQRIQVDTVEWGVWKKLHPDTMVLSRDTGFTRPYGQDPYGGYYSSRDIIFPLENEDARLHPKAIVYGVEFEGKAKAYPDAELAKAVVVNDHVGNKPILVTRDPTTKIVRFFERTVGDSVLEFETRNGKIFDKQTDSAWSFDGLAVSGKLAGTQLNSIIAPAHFWFAWAAFKPGTEVFLVP